LRHFRKVAVNAHQALEIGQFAPQRDAFAQRVHDGGLPRDVGLRAKKGGERVLFLERFRDKFPHVAPEEVRKLVQFET
jgi:hypothetical protein